jgi:eukaryotic-like serine/threonine-protein kinase
VFKRIQDWLTNAESSDSSNDPEVSGNESAQAMLADTILVDVDINALAPLLANDIQNRFQPLRELGRGGTSSVHDAADVRLVRHTALKIMHTNLATQPTLRTQFIIEAQITAQLEHPNIIPIYEYGQDAEGVPYINMRKVTGETLDALIHEDELQRLDADNLKSAVRILLRVCDALAYAHSRGVVHLDIKPSNIMIGQFGEVYVVDWGIAMTGVGTCEGAPVLIETLGRNAATAAPTKSSLSGTPAYMAPEQATGQLEEVDARTDIFLVGATLYNILTGEPPYTGAATLAEVLKKAERGEFAPIDSRTGSSRAPPALVNIANTAMHNSPARRFQTMQELKRALEGFLEGVGHLSTERYVAGDIIVREGEPGDRAYVIVSGHCHVFSGVDAELQTLREIGPGEVFGEMAILSGGVRTSSVAALTDVEVEVVTRESLTDGLGIKTWAGKFVTALAERFIEVDRRARNASH